MQKNFIRFWGVRGSIARTGDDFAAYGGNTSCVEVRYGNELIICDSGTGIKGLGETLSLDLKATILYSHYHWDHVQGLPFFLPIYNDRNVFTIIGKKGLKRTLTTLFKAPYFPVEFKDLGAKLIIKEINDREFKIGKIKVKAFGVNHPNGAFGYRFTFPNKKSITFISDNGPKVDDRSLIENIYGSDLLIHDAQFLPDEFMRRRKFGHSPYHYVLDITRVANIKRAVLYHHDPSHTDKKMKIIEASAQKLGKRIGLRTMVYAAREGMTINLNNI